MTERPRSSARVDARRTLRALRVAERPDDVDVEDVEEEEALVVEALLAYETRLARGGGRAWGGDVGRAVVSSLGGGDRGHHRGSRKRRRRRGGGGGDGDLGDAAAIRRAVSEATETSDAMNGDGDGDGDDRLWLACVNRALGVGVPNRASIAPEIVEAAADCAKAAARSAASSSTDGPARAILAALAPPWLEALCRDDDDDDDDEATSATVARLRACAALIETLGVRLSRSTAVLRRVARFARRRAYGDAASEEVERAAARLAAALPLTGNAAVLESEENEKKDRGGRNTVTLPPDEIWTRALRRALDSLRDKCRSDRETRLDDDDGDDDDAFVRGSVRVAIALLSARGLGRASVALPIDSLLETARLELSRSNSPRRVALGNALLRATLRRVDARTVGRRAVRAVERSLARAVDVPARVDAIRSLRALCETLGSSCAIGDGRRGTTAAIVAKAVTSVASDLTTTTSGATEGCDEDERERWTIAAADCLAAYVAAGGGHVAPRARAIIDDAVGSLAASSEGLVSPAVRDAVLRLASVCVAAPWRDGAACRDSLVENARRVALRRRRVDSATMARWCDAVVVPRAPPLSIVRARREERGHHHDHHETRWEPRTTTTTRSPKARRAKNAKTGTETRSSKQQKTTKEPSKKKKTAADTATDDAKDVEKHDDVCLSAPVDVRRDDKKPRPPPCDNEDDSDGKETTSKSTPTTPTAAKEENYDDDDESGDRAATTKKTATSDHDDNDNEPTSDSDRDAEEDKPTSDPKRTENVAQDDKEEEEDDDDDDSMASDIPDIVDHDDSE